MLRTLVIASVFAGFGVGLCSSQDLEAEVPEWACKEAIDRDIDPNLYTIIDVIHHNKFADLKTKGLLPDGFVSSPEPRVVVCQNYLYSAVLLRGDPPHIVLDIQFIMFLYAQSRALVLGDYIAEHIPRVSEMALHRTLMSKVSSQGDDLISGLEMVESVAIGLGASEEFIKETLRDQKFKEREQGIFLHALHFVLLHERCHLFLDQDPTHEDASSLIDSEINADRCAIEIINEDESQYSDSPISLVAALMTISSHAVIEFAVPELVDMTDSHPSASDRFSHAVALVREFCGCAKRRRIWPRLCRICDCNGILFPVVVSRHWFREVVF